MTTVRHAIHEVAGAQKNLVTLSQLTSVGATAQYAAERLRAGEYQRIHRGVYLIGATPPDWATRVLAAVLAAGPGSRASHRAAAALWGFDGARRGPVEITVEHDRLPNLRGVLTHRTLRHRPDEVVSREGIPTTSVAQTLVDYGAVVPRTLVERAVEDAFNRGLLTPTKLSRHLAAVGGKGWRGSGVLRKVLSHRLDGGPAGSFLEILGAHVLLDAGIGGLTRQRKVRLANGTTFKIDIAVEAALLAIEFDGRKNHSIRRDREYDAWRTRQLEAKGWTLLRVSWDEVVHHPEIFVARVRAALAAAA